MRAAHVQTNGESNGFSTEHPHSDDSDSYSESDEEVAVGKRDSMLVPFVPLHAALADVFCNIPRVLVLTLIVIMTICGMLFIPEDQFTATYVGGSNDGIASTPTFSACVHYCEKTYLDPSGFGRESIGGEGICGVNGSKVKFCLFRSEEPSNCTRVTTNDITDEMMDELGHSVKCSFKYKVTNWHPYFVIGGLAIAITLVIQGLEPEVALLGAVAIFAAAGVVTVKQATAGFASSSVIALALLLPVAKAMEETGLLDRAVSVMLGQPDSFPVALVRMMVPVALLSACLSNTAIVAMLVPVIISWSRRLGCHPGKLMMPLSFAAQLGGSMTLIGSSHCLVARESVREVYEVNFFSTTPAATWLLLVTTIAILVLAPTRLLRHSADPASEGCCDGSAPGAEQSDLLYSTVFVVQQHGALEGAEVDCVLCTLKKLPGVASVSLEEEAGCPAKLHGGALLRCEATAAGVVALRQVRGIEPRAQPQLSLLGLRRKERSLFECSVADPSLLPADERELRNSFGCALVASRRPGSREIPWEPGEGKTPSFRPSDVVLIEADQRYLKEFPERWFSAFSVASQVKDSSPPRNSYKIDAVRAIVVVAGMLIMIALVAAEVAQLSYGCGILLLLLLAIRAITLPELYSSIKVSVIFTIVGATGISNAMKVTGVANFIADVMMSVFQPLGFFGLCAAVYIVSVFLSMWISNSATVSIVGSLIVSMISNLQAEGADNIPALAAAFTWILICGAGSCFTTPLGYQTNLMVMPDGKYTFSDFVVFGGPITLIHCAACIFVVPLLAMWLIP